MKKKGRYEGEMRNGVPEGYGRMSWCEEVYEKEEGLRWLSVYKGEWRRGVPEGEGCIIYDDGALYQGSFRDGQYHGPGCYSWRDGVILQGTWLRGDLASIENVDCFDDDLADDPEEEAAEDKQSWTHFLFSCVVPVDNELYSIEGPPAILARKMNQPPHCSTDDALTHPLLLDAPGLLPLQEEKMPSPDPQYYAKHHQSSSHDHRKVHFSTDEHHKNNNIQNEPPVAPPLQLRKSKSVL